MAAGSWHQLLRVTLSARSNHFVRLDQETERLRVNMSTSTTTGKRTSDTEYVMERTFAASPERVFAAYTKAEQVAQ